MSMENKINNVIRDTIESSSRVNGVWRENLEGWSRINGVWRMGYQPNSYSTITSENITGFRLVYTLNKNRIHHNNPRLRYNPNVPYDIKLTGENIGEMDLTSKGIVLQYHRYQPKEEGIIIYEGRLYAVLDNGQLLNVCSIAGNNNDKFNEDELKSEFTDILEVNKLSNLDIKIDGHVLFEDYGYYFAGWNNLFNTKPFIDPNIYPDHMEHKKKLQLESYNILPIKDRDNYFDSVATIGLARDMNTEIYNMTGSYGILDHTVYEIRVNDEPKPFIIELYQ